MQPTPQRLLETTARSTFESLALLYAEPVAPAELSAAGRIGARVTFAGVARGESAEGTLAVAVTPDVAAALAENMLGAVAAGPAECRDAVGEFANVVCGHVLSTAGGPEAVFHLTAPSPLTDASPPDAPADADGPRAAWHAWLDVEGGRACVTLEAPATLFPASAAEGP